MAKTKKPAKPRRSLSEIGKNTRFKPGVSGNPKGRPPEVLPRMLKQLTAEEFASIANMIVKGNLAELQAVAKDKNASAIKVLVAAIVIKAIGKGDMYTLDVLLNRLVGKVKENIEVTGKDGGPQVILTLPRNGRESKKDGEDGIDRKTGHKPQTEPA